MRFAKLAIFGFALMLQPAFAQDTTPSTQEIVDALLPTGLDGRKIKGARSLDGLLGGNSTGRGVKVIQGKEVPFIDLRVAFEYDSDRLSNDAMLTLKNLGEALGDEAFKNSRFRIVGHTDARGSEDYNYQLSQRRAQAVTRYLAANYAISPDRIEVGAKGKTELLADIAPEDERNRRVEVQNITAAD